VLYEVHKELSSPIHTGAIRCLFEYIYTDWIDFTSFDLSICFPLLQYAIELRLLRLTKIVSQYIVLNLNFANTVEYLNQVTEIEEQFDLGNRKSLDKEFNTFRQVFGTLKKAILKFVTTHKRKFKSMKQYEDLNPHSVLAIDEYCALKVARTNKKSPYDGSPTKRGKADPSVVNTNLLSVDRIAKNFSNELKEIYEDRYHNYTIK